MSSKDLEQLIPPWGKETEKNEIPVEHNDYKSEERKPRLDYYRGLLSMKDPDVRARSGSDLAMIYY